MTPERLGEAYAIRAYFRGEARATALGGLGSTDDELLSRGRAFGLEVSAQLAQGEMSGLFAFQHGFLHTQRKLRIERPGAHAISPDPFLATEIPVIAPARKFVPLPQQTSLARSSALAEVPTYLRVDAAGPSDEPSLGPLARVEVDETMIAPIAALSSAEALPFREDPSPAGPRAVSAAPGLPAEDAGMTAALPSAEELEQMIAHARAPFSSQRSAMTLARYAELRAALAQRGENDEATLREFGLTLSDKEQLQRHFLSRFQAEPSLRDEFQESVAAATGALRTKEGKPRRQ